MIHNSVLGFEWHTGKASPAILTHTRVGNYVISDHTIVPDELRGGGLAAEPGRAALNEARQ